MLILYTKTANFTILFANWSEKCNYLNMKSLKKYITTLLGQGKYFFSKQEVLSQLGLNPIQFKSQAYRLSQKTAIKRLIKDFFMIIPAEYYNLGSLPPHWIVDALMRYLDQEYYIGLLSAASFYGATEQQPMIFQVITTKSIRPIKLQRTSIEFHVSNQCLSALKTTISAPTGYVKISRREQTVVDLVRYYDICGYLSNVALVIKSLTEEIDKILFKQVIEREKINTVLQRTGYLLELIKLSDLALIVEQELSKRELEYVLLRPDFHIKSGNKNERWKLIINDSLEIE